MRAWSVLRPGAAYDSPPECCVDTLLAKRLGDYAGGARVQRMATHGVRIKFIRSFQRISALSK